MEQEIIHQYFKRTADNKIYLVQLDTENKKGVQLEIQEGIKPVKNKLYFQNDPATELLQQGFQTSQALEFHLYLKGLATQ